MFIETCVIFVFFVFCGKITRTLIDGITENEKLWFFSIRLFMLPWLVGFFVDYVPVVAGRVKNGDTRLLSWILCNVHCILLLVSIIVLSYIHHHPEKYYDKDVYMVDLLSITPEIRVNIDLSITNNIIHAETLVVDTILVQRTKNLNYYREIITGKLIPRSGEHKVIDCNDDVTYKYNNYCFPVFAKWKSIEKNYGSSIPKIYDGTDVNYYEVSEYIESRKGTYKGCDSFAAYLDKVFADGELYYQNSLKKETFSDKAQIRNILKELNN